MPYWYKLLIYYDKKHYFQNGLTLPFIIGAITVLEPTSEIFSIKKLLNDFKEHNFQLNVLRCGQINQYVFRPLDVPIAYSTKTIENLAILDDSFSNCYTIEDVILALEMQYSDIIKSHTFSFENTWRKYNDNELSKLNELKMII